MHKAKGLEFPSVVIPYTNWMLKSNPLVFMKEKEGCILAHVSGNFPEDFVCEKYRAKMEDAIEAINLLYVAMTRAKRELHLYITLNLLKNGSCDYRYVAAWLYEMVLHTKYRNYLRC